MTDAVNDAAVIPDAAEQTLLASLPPALPQLNPSADALLNTQVDGTQDAQQNARRFGIEDRLQQVELEEEAAVSLRVLPCGCDEASNHYLENFATFQRHVRDGLKNLKSQDVRYDHIEALMVYWKGGDVPEVAENARGLGNLLERDPYKYTVTKLEIDYQNLSQPQINDFFRNTLREVEDRISARDSETSNLLILYYGGHGVVDQGDRVWQPKKSSVKSLIWSNYQSRMYDIECDILYLFDCCSSLAMVETASTRSMHRRRCEILCSSGLKEESGARDRTVFTGALKNLLAKKGEDILERGDSIGGLTFEKICDTMTKQNIRDTLKAEPRWKVIAPNPAFRGRITIAAKGVETITPQPQQSDSDSGYQSEIESRSQLSDTRILIKIRLTNPAEGLSSDDWLKWFEQRPHNVAHVDIAVVKKIEWVGVFESDSSLILITVPLWLWHNIEQDPACESLGIVRSKNLLRWPANTTASALSVDVDDTADKVVEQKQDSESLRIQPLPLRAMSTESLASLEALPSFKIVPPSPRLSSYFERAPSLPRSISTPSTLKRALSPPRSALSFLGTRSSSPRPLMPLKKAPPPLRSASPLRRAAYQYLPIADDEMRVFILEPGSDDDPLQGTFKNWRPELGEYDFLSYSWETTSMNQLVHVGSKTLNIPPSLEDFLKHVRLRDRPRALWADALCINMGDSLERARLTQLSSLVSSADHVCVWLGNDDFDTERTFDMIRRMSDPAHVGKLQDVFYLPELEALVRRPWFSRRWIVQEIAYARRASIHCGPFRAAWSDFAYIVALYASMNGESDSIDGFRHLPAFRLVFLCENIFRKSNDGQLVERLMPLDSMVCLLYDFKVTNAHDTIYALLSLAKGTGRGVPVSVGQQHARTRSRVASSAARQSFRTMYSFMVKSKSPETPKTYETNYAQPFIDVAVYFVRFTISESKSIDIICRRWAPSNFELPSWIKRARHTELGIYVDGVLVRDPVRSLTSLRGLELPRYRAGGGLRTMPTIDKSGLRSVLTVEGFTLGTMAEFGKTAWGGGLPRDWLELGGWNGAHQDVPAQLWRTLVADRGSDGQYPPPWYSLACKQAFSKSIEDRDMNLVDLVHRDQPLHLQEVCRRIETVISNRTLVKTSFGTLGLVSWATDHGDLVCILHGCSVPVILRPKEEYFELVGECFIYGMMDGEALKLDLPTRTFALV